MSIKFFIISLLDDPESKKRLRSFLSRWEVTCPNYEIQVIEAFDGRGKPTPFWWEGGSGGTYGCYMSHLLLANKIAGPEYKNCHCVIFEDDAIISSDFVSRLEKMIAVGSMRQADIIYLGGKHKIPPKDVHEGYTSGVKVVGAYGFVICPDFRDEYLMLVGERPHSRKGPLRFSIDVKIYVNYDKYNYIKAEPCIVKHNYDIPSIRNSKDGRRIIFTCHEGCDPRVWNLCRPAMKEWADLHGATIVELPKSKHRNPQWVLFDAFQESVKYEDNDSFLWMDSDIVVRKHATDIWTKYPNRMTAAHPEGPFNDKFIKPLGLPSTVSNLCSGMVKWNKSEALVMSEWVRDVLPTLPNLKEGRMGIIGDQSLLVKALYDTKIKWGVFGRSMHKAGGNPPENTAFKHKGGGGKIGAIKNFLETNRKWAETYDMSRSK